EQVAPPPPPPPPASAMELPPPPPPPPPPTDAPPLPPSTSPAAAATGPQASDVVKDPVRYSRFSAGRGGALFVTAEVLAGMVGGGILGAGLVQSSGNGDLRQGVFFGLLGGGLALGTTAMAVQYFHGIGLSSAGAISLAAGVGGLLGLGIMVGAAPTGSLAGWGGALLAGSQVGAALALAFTWGLEDLDPEDLSLMGMTTLYAEVFTLLVTLAVANNTPPAWPMLVAPAVGMAIGAGIAPFVSMKPGRVLKLTGLPLGVGLVLFYLGSAVFVGSPNGNTTLAVAAMAAIAATFTLTFIFTMEDEPASAGPQRAQQGVTVMPSVAVMPAGRRNEALAAGPSLAITF
ncbi:MAG: hypothetical protein K1X89_26125, partial [Myxococcaceae bacterium]|nr:hypothetical protein [Myxococcaceae bacterium]